MRLRRIASICSAAFAEQMNRVCEKSKPNWR